MRLYLEVAKRSFRQTLTYRAATLAGLFTNAVFGVFIATVYVAFYRSADLESGSMQGWSMDQVVTLSWISQSLIMPVFIWGWWEIAATVRTGAFATDLIKPMNYFGYWISRDIGRAIAHFIIRGVPTFVMGSFLFTLDYPDNPARALGFLASIALAVVISFCWRFLLNIVVFWLLEERGIAMLSMAMIGLLSGQLIPLAFYPDAIRPVIEKLPFRGMIQMPAEVYLGQSSVPAGLAFQLLWIVVLLLCGLWLFGQATKKVVVQGG
jgi:ABC-2 type transport system permease protein